MVIISGSSHPSFARSLARSLPAPLLLRTIDRFPNGEIHLRLRAPVEKETVVVVQTLHRSVHDQLMELLLLADAAKRAGAASVIGLIPFLAYSKQDKAFLPGEPRSVEVVARTIAASPFDHLVLLDLHDPAIAQLFPIPTTVLSAVSLFSDQVRSEAEGHAVVISPDSGGRQRSREFASLAGLPIIYLDKQRSLLDGSVRYRGISGEVEYKHCVLFDDMVLTGATAVGATKFLKENGAASITFAATHGLFFQGFAEFKTAGFKQIFITDSVPLSPGAPSFIQVISAVPLVARALKKLVQ